GPGVHPAPGKPGDAPAVRVGEFRRRLAGAGDRGHLGKALPAPPRDRPPGAGTGRPAAGGQQAAGGPPAGGVQRGDGGGRGPGGCADPAVPGGGAGRGPEPAAGGGEGQGRPQGGGAAVRGRLGGRVVQGERLDLPGPGTLGVRAGGGAAV